MWLNYEPSTVRSELQTLVDHGMNVTRSFCYWPDFVPAPEQLDDVVLERFSDFLDAHEEIGMSTIPTFIVGHMSGENWDPVWRQGRDLYRDVWLVSQQAWFAGEIARRFGGHPAVCGWLVSNEMPLYGGSGTAEEIAAWGRLVTQAVRAAGAMQPISLGDGAWGVETTGSDNGYSLRKLAPLIDFIGPHVYPMEDDQVRQLLTPAFVCELCAGFGKPVVLEEFGVSSDFAGGEEAASYYRQVLYSTLGAGARGWLAWNNCDYDGLRDQDPYRHHPFELHFGLTDRHGLPKPQLGEIAEFSTLVSRLAADGWEVVKGDVALVVPEHFERELPFTSAAFREDIRAALLQGYIAAREAQLPVSLVRERDGIETRARLILSPSTKLLTTGGLRRLRELARLGSIVYLSAFAGSTANQRGPWITYLEELFGVRHMLRYGLVDPIEDDIVTFELVKEFGRLAVGTKLQFQVSGSDSARSYLPVESVGAETIAVDGHGRPALVQHQIGLGSTVLCTYPIEYMAAKTPRVNPENTWQIYSALADEAGIERDLRIDDPRVLLSRYATGAGETSVFQNLSSESIEIDSTAVGSNALLPFERLPIESFGVAVVHDDGQTPPRSVLAVAPGSRGSSDVEGGRDTAEPDA
jgi:endo-1,4-beta-mannosidase